MDTHTFQYALKQYLPLIMYPGCYTQDTLLMKGTVSLTVSGGEAPVLEL